MSGFTVLNIGASALAANYAALQTTGHNIANAGVEGYSRQRVEITTQPGQGTGSGFFGRGVRVSGVMRLHDELLTQDAIAKSSAARMDSARLESLRRLETVFRGGEVGIGHAAGQFLNAIVDVANRPSDDSARQVMLARAGEVADRFAQAAREVESIQRDLNTAVDDAAQQVNALAQAIARVNDSIARSRTNDQQPNDMLDERDRLIGQLGQIMQVTTVEASDGSLSVLVAGGQSLVLGNRYESLRAVKDPFDDSRVTLELTAGQAVRPLETQFIGGGDMAGWLRFQDEDLAQARTLLGQMATALASEVNKLQTSGLNLKSPPGFGTDLFDVGGPQVLAHEDNGPGVVSITISDATKLLASEYRLEADPAATGKWQLTRLSDGEVFSGLVNGNVVDGFALNLSSTALRATDRFVLQPVSAAARDMRRILTDPRAIAASSAVTLVPNAQNTGTAAVLNLQVTDTSALPTAAITLTYKASTGEFLVDGVAQTPKLAWTAGQAFTFRGTQVTLDGVPADGDKFVINKTAYPGQNSGNAVAMLALRDSRFIGRDASGEGGYTMTDAYAAAMGDIGVRVQGADTAAQISRSTAETAKERVNAQSGVNLDEEGARLIQFQQAYQAAAKVLQTAQAIFDTLLQAAG